MTTTTAPTAETESNVQAVADAFLSLNARTAYVADLWALFDGYLEKSDFIVAVDLIRRGRVPGIVEKFDGRRYLARV